MQYKKTNRLTDVCGFDPQSGCYSFTHDERKYLSLYDELCQKDEAPLDIRTTGEFLYLWYARVGKLEVYLNKEVLCSVEKNTYLIDGESLYVGYCSDFDEYNLMNPITREFLLSSHIPYKLYVEDDAIIAYDNFHKKEIQRIDNNTEILWSFPLVDLGEDHIYTPGEVDSIVKILGIVGGLLWFKTDFARLIALDVATGKPVYQLSCNPADKDKPQYKLVEGIGNCYLREGDRAIVGISSSGFQTIDPGTGEVIDSFSFREADPTGIGTYRHVFNPLLQGGYFTFLGEKEGEYSEVRRVGIFDYKARRLVWECEVISEEEYLATGNHLLVPQPLYMSGGKLYIKDSQDTLHIFERVDG